MSSPKHIDYRLPIYHTHQLEYKTTERNKTTSKQSHRSKNETLNFENRRREE
uniref:Uncharacterized protein n=1 Tax=Rhizophora mucronata TaxID=61149 RepID=A0A2P2NLW2_RHIMU